MSFFIVVPRHPSWRTDYLISWTSDSHGTSWYSRSPPTLILKPKGRVIDHHMPCSRTSEKRKEIIYTYFMVSPIFRQLDESYSTCGEMHNQTSSWLITPWRMLYFNSWIKRFHVSTIKRSQDGRKFIFLFEGFTVPSLILGQQQSST